MIVLDGGETSGEDRLPYLDTGIVDILAEATGGVGVVLEHRYYGTLSSPSQRGPWIEEGRGGKGRKEEKRGEGRGRGKEL